jgi:hypothetical protein
MYGAAEHALGAESLLRSQREKSADRGAGRRRPEAACKRRKEAYR